MLGGAGVTVSQYHSFVTMLGGAGQHARIIALDTRVVLVQLCSCWLYGAQNRGWRKCKSQILIYAKQFFPPSKWLPWHEPCLPYPRYATAYDR